MIEFIRQKKILILVVLITLAGIIGIGYQSAEQKSEPIYRSKIDRIMYDTHNQSPKYVITLPDRNKKSKKPEEVVSVGEEAFQAETTAKKKKIRTAWKPLLPGRLIWLHWAVPAVSLCRRSDQTAI